MGLPRSSYYYQPQQAQEPADKLIVSRIEELPGYGYRRVTAQLHRGVTHIKVVYFYPYTRNF